MVTASDYYRGVPYFLSYPRDVRKSQFHKGSQITINISAGIDNRFTKIDNTNAWQHAMLIMSVGSTAQLWKLWKPGKQVEMRQWLQNSALRFSAPSADIVALKKMRAGYRAATGGLCSEARQIAEKSAAGIGHRFIKIDNTNAWQHAMLLMLVGSTA